MIDYKVLEYGKVVMTGSHGIVAEWVVGLDRKLFPMLGHVIPYDDTMFNSWQVQTLHAELDALPHDHPLVPDVRDDLRSLCTFVLSGTHRQLWLLGD